ncbi:hypothetical protein NDU88_004220 [Pleurodeles waltl]|uniref:Secreted protein n=1 Tax=Pleurodeles waltl TaxID=8319 RepID=A0AAV7W4P4_PLEWA|nr:hypothetical protein NDU88_004220 [Pleurodeles waltl]
MPGRMQAGCVGLCCGGQRHIWVVLVTRVGLQPGTELPWSFVEATGGNGGRVSTSRKLSAVASREAGEVGKAGKAAADHGEVVWWQEVGNVACTGSKAE